MSKLLSLITMVLASAPVLGQENASNGSAETAARAPDTLATVLTLGAGLLAVIAIIYGCAWLIRRMTGMTGMNNNAIRVVSVMAIGARERIALVEVGGQQILLGITPSAIRTLQVFEEPVVDAGKPPDSEFARRLQSMIGKSWTSSKRND